MALSDLDVKEQYSADGVLTTFAIPFTNIFDDSLETTVYIDDVLQVEGSGNDYTLTGSPDPVDPLSFHTSVEFNTAPTSGTTVTVRRVLALTQALDLVSAGTVNLGTLERHLDGIVAKIQQVDEALSRVLLLKVTTPLTGLTLPDPVSLNILGWNTAADAIINVDRTELAGSSTIFTSTSIVDAQSATDVDAASLDGAVYSSGVIEYEVVRGTTVFGNGRLSLQYRNNTWRVEDGGYDGDAHGMTFSIVQTTTNGQLQVALDAGAGNGTIKVSTTYVPT